MKKAIVFCLLICVGVLLFEVKTVDDAVEEIKEVEEISIQLVETSEETEVETQQLRVYFTVVDDGYTAYLDTELQNWVYELCSEYEIEGFESLVVAVLYHESSFRTNIIHENDNGSCDYGIAQINTCNHERLQDTLGITDFLDPYQSIRCGVYMLSEHLKNNGYNVHKALVAYNMGQSAVDSGVTESSYSRKIVEIRKNLIREELEVKINE